MGSKNRDIIVGYDHFLGTHGVLCQYPIDGIVEIAFDDRSGWTGSAGTTSIEVNRPQLWGDKEGGPAGFIDVLHGGPTQGTNDYLRQVLANGTYAQAQAGAFANPANNPGLVSAFRGAVSVVLRRFGWGRVPRLRRIRFKALSVLSTYRETANHGDWMPQIAPVCPEYGDGDYAVYIAMDNSGSFTLNDDLTDATPKDIAQRAAIKTVIDSLAAATGRVALRIQPFNEQPRTGFQRIPFTAADAQAAKDFVDAQPAGAGQTSFNLASQPAAAFFAAVNSYYSALGQPGTYTPALQGGAGLRIADYGLTPQIKPIVLFLSDGFPTIGQSSDAATNFAPISGVQIYAFGFSSVGDMSVFDNTPMDGVPLLQPQDYSGITSFLQAPFMSFADLNPAHLARDMLISPRCGGDGDTTQIAPNFRTVAQTLYDENFGLTVFWDTPSDRDGVREMLERTVACAIYRDRATDLWDIKLIRPDYNPANLFTFDRTTIVKWVSGPETPLQDDLPNQITLTYTRRDNGQEAALTQTNPAALQAMTRPRIINEKVEMPEITKPELANTVLLRELAARTQPITRGAIRVTYVPTNINRGDAVIVDDPLVGINNLVMRVLEIKEGPPDDPSVVLYLSQDVFQLPMTVPATAADDPATTGRLSQAAVPADVILIEELTYFDGVFARGQATADQVLAANPDAGFWAMTGNQPTPAHNTGRVVEFNGASWIDLGSAFLMPVWQLSAALGKDAGADVQFTATVTGREGEIVAGQLLQIGSELVRVDNISVNGAVATFAVGRGCLDTVPALHAAGAYVFAPRSYTRIDPTERTSGEIITARLLTQTSSQTLDINLATSQTTTMNSRAIRPLPVGQLKVSNAYTVIGTQSGTVNVTWVHRDRLLQTTPAVLDHDDASIGPEAGVSYHLVRRWIEDTGSGEAIGGTIETAVSPSQATSTTVDLNAGDMAALKTANTIAMEIGIRSKRTVGPTTYENWQTPYVRVAVAGALSAPYNLAGVPV